MATTPYQNRLADLLRNPTITGEMRATPQNSLATLSNALSGFQAGSGPVGQFLLGEAPQTLQDMSYGRSPVRGSGMTNSLTPGAVDLASMLPVGGALKAGALAKGLASSGAIKAGLAGIVAHHKLPEFQNWFKGSKVVDESGKPLRLYHGTTEDFNEFKPGGNNERLSGRAIWLTDDGSDINAAHNIGGFNDIYRDNTRVLPVYANISKPLIVNAKRKPMT